MEVTAEVSRSGAWWAVEVPEVPGAFTQAERLDQVEAAVVDAVRTRRECDDLAVTVTVAHRSTRARS